MRYDYALDAVQTQNLNHRAFHDTALRFRVVDGTALLTVTCGSEVYTLLKVTPEVLYNTSLRAARVAIPSDIQYLVDPTLANSHAAAIACLEFEDTIRNLESAIRRDIFMNYRVQPQSYR